MRYQYPDGSEHSRLPSTVPVDGVNLYTARMTAGDLYALGYKQIVDATPEVPEGQQRAGTYTDLDTGARIERTYDLEAVPPPTVDEQRAALQAQLAQVDASSVRSLRAVLAAQAASQTPAAEDLAYLADLEAQAVSLRAELATLTGE